MAQMSGDCHTHPCRKPVRKRTHPSIADGSPTPPAATPKSALAGKKPGKRRTRQRQGTAILSRRQGEARHRDCSGCASAMGGTDPATYV